MKGSGRRLWLSTSVIQCMLNQPQQKEWGETRIHITGWGVTQVAIFRCGNFSVLQTLQKLPTRNLDPPLLQ